MNSSLPEKCPSCGGRISIASGCDDSAKAGWSCYSCGAFSSSKHDHPDITRGVESAESLEGVHFMHEAITSLSANIQIGILRERHNKDAFGKKFKDCD